MDYLFEEYPFSYNRKNYHATPSPPSWFEDNYRPAPAPTPAPTPTFHPFIQSPTPAQPFCFQDNYPAQPPRRKARSARKDAVSIPVNFIPKKPTTSDYALKIQKVFRGFRVRRNLNKILQLNSAVNDVANTFTDEDKVELMRCSERERLKVNEILMGLLFKLDSIGALNDSIRLSRKAVIKKAISLQEKIDSLAAAAEHQTSQESGGKGVQTLEESGGKGDETLEKTEGKGVQTLEEKDPEGEIGEKSWTMQVEDEDTLELADAQVEEKLTDNGDQLDIEGAMTGVDQMQLDSTDGDADAWECVGDNVEFVEKDGESSPKREFNDEWFVIEEEEEEETKESNKLLQKMAEDNKRLIQMVADLCQKNATQTALITSLSDRVEKLEQAMIDDRLRRKKKEKKTTTTTTLKR